MNHKDYSLKPKSLPNIADRARVKYRAIWDWVRGININPLFSEDELLSIEQSAEKAKKPLDEIIKKAQEERQMGFVKPKKEKEAVNE